MGVLCCCSVLRTMCAQYTGQVVVVFRHKISGASTFLLEQNEKGPRYSYNRASPFGLWVAQRWTAFVQTNSNCVAKGMADPMDCRGIETVPSSRLVSAHPTTSCSFYWRAHLALNTYWNYRIWNIIHKNKYLFLNNSEKFNFLFFTPYFFYWLNLLYLLLLFIKTW